MYIYNAVIHTMEGYDIKNGYVKIENGKFVEVNEGIPRNLTDTDINAGGMNMYPGFIDAHTVITSYSIHYTKLYDSIV